MAIFRPTYALRSITEITPAALKKRGIKALILDVDNTLTTHNNPTPAEGIAEWVEGMKSVGIKLLIVSNNKAERVTPFAEILGLHFVPNGAKPLPKGFRQAIAELRAEGIPKNRIAAVGDQIFTDILGANLAGIRSIFVYPIEFETSLPFRFKRAVEKPLLPKRFNRFD
ncbi:MAG: YqeG family HAD IIIA-type phosphatase [Oscillospiraceae bacterium]|nr:YqeG family HAD IIIA-type phosphatase [Oscillospiraceae bacterium]